MIDNEVVTRIAQKLRATRLEKNMTIQQLATRTHVSKGLLSKIENSRTIPSLPVFVTLIQSLDISLKDFFQDMILANGQQYKLIKKEHYTNQLQPGGNGLDCHHLFSQNIPGCTMKAVMLSIGPETKGKASTIDGYEFGFVLSGSCEYQINDELVLLHEGDAIYLDGTIPHSPMNRSNEAVSILIVYFMLAK